MSKSVRTVRFDENEVKLIESFLKKNSFFDFSTLARIAIRKFIQNPDLHIEPVKAHDADDKKGGRHVTQ